MMTIKGVPMVTDDGMDIELNSVVYTAIWKSGYSFNATGDYDIEAHRVISVDNSRRFFRTRCVKGCETEHHFSKGCSREPLYGSLAKAKFYIEVCIQRDHNECDKKIAKVEATKKHLTKVHKDVLGMTRVRIPKEVK